jgi:predicted Zn-dependent protease
MRRLLFCFLGLSVLLTALPATAQQETVYLMGIGKFDRKQLAGIKKRLTTVAGVNVVIKGSLALPKSAFDKERNQYSGTDLTAAIGKNSSHKGKWVVAFTAEDLFSSTKPEWRYCFSQYGGSRGNHAVFSDFRMRPENYGGPADPALVQARLEKMVLSFVGRYMLGKPSGKDPTSLLYQPILGPNDLDKMEYRY